MNPIQILNEANLAGNAAFEAAIPEPMVVVGGSEKYFVSEGPCGFAWVKIKGNTAFGKYCKKNGIARNSYPNGLQISDPHMSQSYDRKMAWAYAFAEVLNANGIEAYADGRLD